jgi:hypothetical protein
MTVKDEFAGKTGKCPSCGTPVKVPALAPAKQSWAPPGEVDQDTVEGDVSTPNPERPALPPAPPGSIRAQCTACGKTMNVKIQFAGKVGKCPGCGKPVKVPAAPPPVEEDVEVEELPPKPVRRPAPPVDDKAEEEPLPKPVRRPAMPAGLELEDVEEPEVDEEPAPRRKPAAKKPPRDEEEDEAVDEEEADDEIQARRKPAKRPPRDEEEDEPDKEEEHITTSPRSKARAAEKPAHDEEDEPDEEQEDEDEDAPKPRRKRRKSTAGAAATFEKLYKLYVICMIACAGLVVLHFILVSIGVGAVASAAADQFQQIGKGKAFPPPSSSTGTGFAIIGLLITVNQLLIFAASVATAVVICMFLYKAWDMIQDGKARTTPGQAIGFLFIPFFNLYWTFVAWWGLSQDLNAYAEEHDITARQAAVDKVFLALILCLIPCVNIVGIVFFILALRTIKDACVDIATAKAG